MEALAQNSFKAFILASRLKTLGAIICPVLMGSVLAIKEHHFSVPIFLVTITCALMLQILANLVNDYGDFIRGADAFRLGPKRAMQQGLIAESVMKKAIMFLIAIITFLGLFLIREGGLPILLVGIGSLFMSLWYTMGKRPLAYLGFSEIVVFLLFGPTATVGSYYVQCLSFSKEALILSFTPGFLSAALLLTNNLRDISEDKRNHKLTLAVRLGESFSRKAIIFFVLLSAIPLLFFSPWILLVAPLLLPMRYFPMILKDPINEKFNLMLMSIGQSLYLIGFLSLGILWG